MKLLRHLLAVVVCCCAMGCQLTSKYALDDPDYAAKYDRPYEGDQVEKIERMSKQLVDARHVAQKGGFYVGGGGGRIGGGANVGIFGYATPWLSLRGGLALVGSSAAEDFFTGGEVGMRVQPPSRLAPFAGIGAFTGTSHSEDDCDCERHIDGYFSAVYPEVGLHYWWNGHFRTTASAQYWINTEGRDADGYYVGLSAAVLLR